MNLKLNFQISIPHNLDIYGGNISLIDIKPHFMTQDFYLSISVLAPSENVWKYDQVSFDLSNQNLKKGNCSLDFNEDNGTHRFVKIWKQNGEVFEFNG